jgi:predicted dienelactone hydrolase
MSRNRESLYEYLAERRLLQTSFVIDEMIGLNATPSSPFYRALNEDAIGICGHSMGGLTVLGKVGAYPDKSARDGRIKAALAFSAPSYPFERSAENIDAPVMIMAGDNDEPGLRPDIPRRTVYERAKSPKYYLILKDATHFVFGNRGCGELPLYRATDERAQTKAICQYGLAFFEKYLSGNPNADRLLEEKGAGWLYYTKEGEAGEAVEWGEEPPPGKGGAGGIKEEVKTEFKKRSLREGWFRRRR